MDQRERNRRRMLRTNKKRMKAYGMLFLRPGARVRMPRKLLDSEDVQAASSSRDIPDDSREPAALSDDLEISGGSRPRVEIGVDVSEGDSDVSDDDNDSGDDDRDDDDGGGGEVDDRVDDGDDNDDDGDDNDDDGDDNDDDGDDNDDDGDDNDDDGDDNDDDGDDNDDDGGDDDDDDAHDVNNLFEDVRAPFQIAADFGLDVPLEADVGVSAKDHLLVAMSLAIRHKWSYVSLMDMLRWTSESHLRNRLPRTKDRLWTILSRNPASVKKHYYCQECRGHLGEEVTEPCACSACGPNEPNTQLGYFLQLSMASQLKQLLSAPNVSRHLTYRFDREKLDINALEDIYDGAAYKNLCSEGNILNNPNNFSLTFNTDGCQVSNSSHTSAWPIYAQINELPPHMRKKHVLLAGIYVCVKHPLLNNYFGPFIDEARQLYHDGITWERRPGVRVTSKFAFIIGCLDSPARASLMRMVQFNGRHGCLHCLAMGESLGPGKFVYPIEQAFGQLRRHNEVVADMMQAFRTETTVRGMKGISCLTGLPGFDVCAGMVVDSMHAIYLGVVKQHTRLLLESVGEPYYIGSPNYTRIIDGRLLSIKPPSRRSRTPRTIASWKNWKASELRNWLGYSVMCLEGLIHGKYIHHLALLTEAVHIINGESITPAQLDRADTLFRKYGQLFQQFFGLENMSFNQHVLTHITTCVRNWGPIWNHSAFVFESWNKKILDRITSPHARTDQVAARFLMEKFIIAAVHANDVSPAARRIMVRVMRIIENGHGAAVIAATGKFVERPPTIAERRLLLRQGHEPEILRCYRYLKCHGIRYQTEDAVVGKKCDSVVFVANRYYGVILNIVVFDDDGNERRTLFVKTLRHISYAFNTRHIHKVQECAIIRCVDDIASIRPAVRIAANPGYWYVYPLSNCSETD